MSLVLAACYRDGVLLASDPFVFDNAPQRPSRRLDFYRFHLSTDQQVVFASVGAVWVFRSFWRRFDAECASSGFRAKRVAASWSSLCEEWRRGHAERSPASGRGSLRPVSDSLLLAVRRRRPWRIDACDSAGRWRRSRTCVVTGSAAGWVREHLTPPANRFDARDSLATCFDKVQACFAAAACDLFVIGFPSIALVTSDGIVDFSSSSRAVWQGVHAASFDRLRRRIERESAAEGMGAR